MYPQKTHKYLPRLPILLSVVCAIAMVGVFGRFSSADERLLVSPTMPLKVELTADETAISDGAVVVVQVTVRAEAALSGVRITITGEGPVELPQDVGFDRDTLEDGEAVHLGVPVRYTDRGHSKVFVEVHATIAGSTISFSEDGEFNVYLRDDRAFAGMDSPLQLMFRAVEYDLRLGRTTPEAAASQRRTLGKLRIVPGPIQPERGHVETWSDPVLAVPPAPSEDDSAPLPPGGQGGTANAATIHVHGKVQWEDQAGKFYPTFGVTVEIRDNDTIGSELIATVITDKDGKYDKTVTHDDGVGQGDPDIFVRFWTINGYVRVRPLSSTTAFEYDSPVHDETPDGGEVEENAVCLTFDTGPACSVLSAMTWAAWYVQYRLNSGVPLPMIDVVWPGTPGASFFNGSLINIAPNRQFAWDVMHHEYGHYVMRSFNFENNPGGSHTFGDCISVTPPTDGDPPVPIGPATKDRGIRLAWGEGWPTYFGTSAQKALGLGQTQAPWVGDAVYTSTSNGVHQFSIQIEANSNDIAGAADNTGRGEDNEVAVTRLLWDLYDDPSDSRDSVSYDDVGIFNVFKNSGATTLSQAWGLWRAAVNPGNTTALKIGAVTTDHAIGPQPTLPVNGAVVGLANRTFRWRQYVGCDAAFYGDQFDLNFYDANTFATVLTKPNIAGNEYTLTGADLAILAGSGPDLLWAVEGRNTANPATGPYLGDHNRVTLGGACCDRRIPDPVVRCRDDIAQAACIIDDPTQVSWHKSTACANLNPACDEHTGACCDMSVPGGECRSRVLPRDCDTSNPQIRWYKELLCIEDGGTVDCLEHTGACCDQRIADPALRCEDDVPESLCPIDDPRQVQWYKDTRCSDIDCPEHTGACCDEDTFGDCRDNVPASGCNCKKCVFYKDTPCNQIVCLHKSIPTVSDWGLVVMTLLLLTGAKVYFGRRVLETRD